MNKTPSSRASWRYVIAGILLIAATMAGGSAVAHDNGRSSQSTKAQSTKASGPKAHPRSHGMSGTRHHHKRHHHWKKSHRPAPVLSPKQTTEPTTPTPPAQTDKPTTPTPQTGFPNASNTGVPAGTKLAAYTGPCTITANNTTIDAKSISCNLSIRASGVKISNSKITGTVATDENSSGYSFTISDSDVNAGQRENTGIGAVNFKAIRVDVQGGNRSIHCYKSCTVQDSYVHGQFKDSSGKAHESGIRMGQSAIIRHNTITCDAPDVPPDAGCSAGLTGYGDFAPVQNNLIEGNMFLAGTGGYCVYGGSSQGKPYSSQTNHIVFRDNVWEVGSDANRPSCYYGPITSFDPKVTGNVWENNKFDNGKVVQSAN